MTDEPIFHDLPTAEDIAIAIADIEFQCAKHSELFPCECRFCLSRGRVVEWLYSVKSGITGE